MEPIYLKDLSKGALFTYHPVSDFFDDVPEHLIYIRGDYVRSLKRYRVISYLDSCRVILRKPDLLVYPL